jgi:hypothetical protein
MIRNELAFSQNKAVKMPMLYSLSKNRQMNVTSKLKMQKLL